MANNWVTNANHLSNPKLSAELRRDAGPIMRFRQFVRKEPALGKNTGDTVDFTRVSKLANLATVQIGDGGTLDLADIPEQDQVTTQSQLTIQEYGQAIPYTGKLETLSEYAFEPIIMETLRMNMAESIDGLIASEFVQSAKVKGIPTGAGAVTFETNGFSTSGGYTNATVNVSTFHIQECVDALKQDYNCPPYDGSDYMAIGITKALRGIKDSTDFKDAAKYGDPQRLFDGEVGRWYGVRFIETTNTTALSPWCGTGDVCGEMVLFGADPVIEAVAIEPEIRVDLPTNFGRHKKIAWYAIMGWKQAWHEANPGPGQARVIHIGDWNRDKGS
jgi:N4-gp56 family major capsid protein